MITIITPAATHDMTVLATVKTRLGITTTADDDLLASLITAYSGVAEDYTNRVFAEETVEETFRFARFALRPSELWLERYPVTEIVSATDGDTTLTSDDYELDGDKGKLLRLNGNDIPWFWTGPKVVIRYTAGYALLDSLPFGIEEAVIEMVKATYLARNRDPMLKSQQVIDVGTEQYWVGGVPGQDGGLPDTIRDKLDKHRRVSVG